MKRNNILGLIVFCNKDFTIIGTVKEIMLYKEELKIKYFIINDKTLDKSFILPFAEGTFADAVLHCSKEELIEIDTLSFFKEIRCCKELFSYKNVFDKNEEFIGKISDYSFNDENGKLEEIYYYDYEKEETVVINDKAVFDKTVNNIIRKNVERFSKRDERDEIEERAEIEERRVLKERRRTEDRILTERRLSEGRRATDKKPEQYISQNNEKKQEQDMPRYNEKMQEQDMPRYNEKMQEQNIPRYNDKMEEQNMRLYDEKLQEQNKKCYNDEMQEQITRRYDEKPVKQDDIIYNKKTVEQDEIRYNEKPVEQDEVRYNEKLLEQAKKEEQRIIQQNIRKEQQEKIYEEEMKQQLEELAIEFSKKIEQENDNLKQIYLDLQKEIISEVDSIMVYIENKMDDLFNNQLKQKEEEFINRISNIYLKDIKSSKDTKKNTNESIKEITKNEIIEPKKTILQEHIKQELVDENYKRILNQMDKIEQKQSVDFMQPSIKTELPKQDENEKKERIEKLYELQEKRKNMVDKMIRTREY